MIMSGARTPQPNMSSNFPRMSPNDVHEYMTLQPRPKNYPQPAVRTLGRLNHHMTRNPSGLMRNRSMNASQKTLNYVSTTQRFGSRLNMNHPPDDRSYYGSQVGFQTLSRFGTSLLQVDQQSMLGGPADNEELTKRQQMLNLVSIAIFKAQSIDEYERENALRFLQHATFKNVQVKDMIRYSGGIKHLLISLREEQSPKLLLVSVGILLNCCYKSQSNKLEVYNTQGIPDIVSLLARSPSIEISVKLLKLLWNLSVAPELKDQFIEFVIEPIVTNILVKHIKLIKKQPTEENLLLPTLKIIANIHISAKCENPLFLCEVEKLVESILNLLKMKIERERLVSLEACKTCFEILRRIHHNLQPRLPGLSYPAVVTMKFSKKTKKKIKKNSKEIDNYEAKAIGLSVGAVVLQHQSTINLYCDLFKYFQIDYEAFQLVLKLLNDVVQGYSKLAALTRKSLVCDPNCMEVLKKACLTKDEALLFPAVLLLHHLAKDTLCNLKIDDELVSNFAFVLPNEANQSSKFSNETISAVLLAIKSLTTHNTEKVKCLYASGGLSKVMMIRKSGEKGPLGFKAHLLAVQVLEKIWMCKKSQRFLKKSGCKSEDFITKPK